MSNHVKYVLPEWSLTSPTPTTMAKLLQRLAKHQGGQQVRTSYRSCMQANCVVLQTVGHGSIEHQFMPWLLGANGGQWQAVSWKSAHGERQVT